MTYLTVGIKNKNDNTLYRKVGLTDDNIHQLWIDLDIQGNVITQDNDTNAKIFKYGIEMVLQHYRRYGIALDLIQVFTYTAGTYNFLLQLNV